MSKKARKSAPIEGDAVRLMGRKPFGKLRKILGNDWCVVAWESYVPGPKVVHLKELEVVSMEGLRVVEYLEVEPFIEGGIQSSRVCIMEFPK